MRTIAFLFGLLFCAVAQAQQVPFPVTGCTSIVSASGKATPGFDNTPAFNAAIAVNNCVYFPTGTWEFAGPLARTLSVDNQSFAVYGDGPDHTRLYWPGGGGLQINGTANLTNFHIRDLSILTGAANVGIGIDANWSLHNNGASSTIDRVRVSGATIGAGQPYWATGVRLNGVSQTNMNGLDIWGQMPGEDVTPTQSIGLDLNASASNLTFIFNIVNSSFFGAKWGLRYGPGVQGVAAVNTNFTNNAIGVYVTPSALNEAQAQLSVQNSAMDNQVWNVQVETGSSLTHMMYVGNATYLRTGFGGGGLNIKSGGQYTISDNHFTTVQTKFVGTAVLLEGGVGGIVSNNMCIDLLNCIEIKDPSLGYGIRGNVINAGNAAQRAVKNTTALNAPNYITGFQDMAHNYYPNALAVTAAVSQSGAVNGLIQVTTLQDATQLVKDQLVLLTAPGLSNQPAIYRIQQIPDANTVILAGSAFNGSLTSAGALSVVP